MIHLIETGVYSYVDVVSNLHQQKNLVFQDESLQKDVKVDKVKKPSVTIRKKVGSLKRNPTSRKIKIRLRGRS